MGKKERKECMLRNGGLLLEKRISYFDGRYSNPMRSFSAKELQKATDNYNHKNLIFAYSSHFDWYKGCLEGRVIFVKKYFDYSHPRRFGSFYDPERVSNEISVAAQLSGHKNSLKLLGCCLETQFPTLVFEFPTNGNLMDQLTLNPICLSWKSRLQIGYEIATLIAYLHTAFPRPILHRDINPHHFYLDQDFCAKLSDFIYSVPLPEGKTQLENEFIYGTKGLTAPEVVSAGVYSEKSDVFDIGLFLFPLLAGKDYVGLLDNAMTYGALGNVRDVTQCTQWYTRNHGINGIIDPTILAEGGGINHHLQLQAVLQLILKCCSTNAEERPIMLDVAKQLKRIQRGNFISDEVNGNDASSPYNVGLTRLLCHRKPLE